MTLAGSLGSGWKTTSTLVLKAEKTMILKILVAQQVKECAVSDQGSPRTRRSYKSDKSVGPKCDSAKAIMFAER